MTKVIARVGEAEYINPTLVNVGAWWDKTWLLVIGGQVTMAFVIEADYEQDALDEFVDSDWGHLIIDADADKTDYDENQSYAGNESKAVNLDYVHIFKCEVDYDGLILEEDNLPAWNMRRVEEYNKIQAGHENEVNTPLQNVRDELCVMRDRALELWRETGDERHKQMYERFRDINYTMIMWPVHRDIYIHGANPDANRE